MISSAALVLAVIVCLAFGVAASQLIFSVLFAAFRAHRSLLSTSTAAAPAVQSSTAKI